MNVPAVDKVKLDNIIKDDTPKISDALELYSLSSEFVLLVNHIEIYSK
tara:strand:+ start:346 stop:489 length:144 start_codon:yes stop_codon:yes gene_type:complete